MHRLRPQMGFSMIEVMSAISLFSIVALGLSTSTISNMQLNTRSKTYSAANALVQNKIEQLRLAQPTAAQIAARQPPDVLTFGTHPTELVTALDGTSGTFSRSYTVSTVPQYLSGSSVGARPWLVEIVVTVSWTSPFAGSTSAVSYACSSWNCG